MVQKCCVCRSRKSQDNDIALHRFPKEQTILNTWIQNINKDYNFVPSVHTRICSKHFNDDDFFITEKRKFLKPGAIPVKMMGVCGSLLSRFQNSSDGIVDDNNVLDDYLDISTNTNLSEPNLTPRKLYCRYIGDFTEADMSNPWKRRCFWKIFLKTTEKTKKKIHLLQRRNRIFKSKINKLKILNNELRRNVAR